MYYLCTTFVLPLYYCRQQLMCPLQPCTHPHADPYNPSRKHIAGRVTPAGVVTALRNSSARQRLHVLKLDFDGFECPLIEAVLNASFRPRLVIVEANPAWSPPFYLRTEYAPEWGYMMGGRFLCASPTRAATLICSKQLIPTLPNTCPP